MTNGDERKSETTSQLLCDQEDLRLFIVPSRVEKVTLSRNLAIARNWRLLQSPHPDETTRHRMILPERKPGITYTGRSHGAAARQTWAYPSLSTCPLSLRPSVPPSRTAIVNLSCSCQHACWIHRARGITLRSRFSSLPRPPTPNCPD